MSNTAKSRPGNPVVTAYSRTLEKVRSVSIIESQRMFSNVR